MNYNRGNQLVHKFFCFLSDDLEHDTCFFCKLQQELINILKRDLPKITSIKYFTDGCAAQYKNYKNFLNLCHHKEDLGINAEFVFFATSHGKSPYDGIGGQ